MTTTLILKSWTDRAGRERRYVNNLAEVIGLEVKYYKTGNISDSSLNGEHIAHAAARRILDAKVWLDAENEVHVDYWNEPYVLTEQQVHDLVAAAYAAQTATKEN